MKPWWMRFAPRNAAGEGGGEGGGDGGSSGAGGDGGAAGGAGAAGDGASGAGGQGDGKGGAAAGGAGGGDGGKAGAAAGGGDGKGGASGADTKGIWPDDWRQNIAGQDDKLLQRLQRYGSPGDVAKALVAAQNRISSGELLPKLSKNASAEEIKEWREAHGIPDEPGKYDLGKDVKIEDNDKAFFDRVFKAAHATNQTPEQVRATVKTFYEARQALVEQQHDADRKAQTTAEDALRAEWGKEFRRNMNLVHGLLDGTGTPDLKDQILGGRLADGTPIGSSPEALKMLLGLALINNPTGTVVEGGTGVTGEGVRNELEKLQKIPANKKTPEQDARQRQLIDAAIHAGVMDSEGNWKK